MALKGASPDHEGEERADRWSLSDPRLAAGRRWRLEPLRDLRRRRSPHELTRRDRLLAWIVTGPVGRFVAFIADLAAYGWRWALRRTGGR